MPASSALLEVLTLCEQYYEVTEKAISCRVGKLIQAWRNAEKNDVMPEPDMLMALATEIDQAPLVLNVQGKLIHRPDAVVFAVDAIAKGWILDRATEAALESGKGVAGVILNIGGDLKIAGNVSGHAPRIGIAGPNAGDNEAPMETILVNQGGVASSGSGMRDMKIAGRSFSHIVSPVTGMPQLKVARATVVAPTAVQADALATAFSSMGIAESLSFANSHEGVEVVIVTTGGARFTSNGWSSLMAPVEKLTALDAGIDNAWPADYQLSIEYEVPPIEASNYEAPYVVMWITDENKKLVRSLLMLGNAPRWVEENHRFWRRYGRKQPALIDTLAQPTRKPGQYRLVWDGRNDAGVPIPQGTYILHVEASREHGGHTYVQRELQFLDTVMENIIPAEEELGEVILHYGLPE
jgi:thiamine biosynthesis lipoprotein